MPDDTCSVDNPLLQAALAYAARGWPVFPCKPGEKAPLTSHGFKDASTDEATIRAWWSRYPDANVAIATGEASGLFVVDEDPGGADTIAALDLPATYTVQTPRGGRHYYFALPVGVTLGNSTRKLGAHVDTRGTGGYVVAPPSSVGDNPYTVDADVPVGDLPRSVVERLEKKQLSPSVPPIIALACAGVDVLERARRYLATVPGAVSGEQGHPATFRAASALVNGFALAVDDARPLLQEWNARCSPPWGGSELEHKLEDAGKAGTFNGRARGCLLEERGEWGPGASPTSNARGERQAEVWSTPTPLHDVEVPTFPVDALPPVLAAYVAALAESTQTPPDLAAFAVLATASAACARRIEVEPALDWREPTNLYMLAVAESGSRKSAVFSAATRPLHEAERERIETAMPAIAEARSERRVLEGQLAEAEKKAAKASTTDNTDSLNAEAAELARRLAESPPPEPPCLLADDVTPERASAIMEANGERLALLSTEGGIFGTFVGRYSKNGAPNLDVLLKGHSGDDLKVDRVMRAPVHLSRPALTIGIAVQPFVLAGLFERQDLKGPGLLARFLYALPRSNVGYRKTNTAPVPVDVARSYNAAIRRVVDEAWPAEPLVVPLSSEAQGLFRTYRDQHEASLRPDEDLGTLKEWGSKLPGALMRIAGIFHQIEGNTGEISAATLGRAIALAPYLAAHATAAHAVMGADPATEDARAVLRHVKRRRLEAFSRRDLFSDLKSRFLKVDRIDAPLALLEDHGFIRSAVPPVVGPKGGRPASRRYMVNPLPWSAEGGA